MTADEIKYSLMCYFRFNRQWLCATECLNCDVLTITKKDIIEVEVKVNKYDLWKGEERKSKHKGYKILSSWFKTYHANRFYICVPADMVEEARKWVEAINKDYGIIRCSGLGLNDVSIAKTAKTLHNKVSETLKDKVMMRVCSENIGLRKQILDKKRSA